MQQPDQKPDPLVLVAQACYPQLLCLDDLLAARGVCKAWRQSLSTAFVDTWRLPHSLWAHAGDAQQPRLARGAASAAAAYPHAGAVVLDSSSGCRPALLPSIWPGLQRSLGPWTAGAAGAASNGASGRRVRLHLHAPPSPVQLAALQDVPLLQELHVEHTHPALYSRHLGAVAGLTQLRALELVMLLPKVELRTLAHQRIRRVPLRADCLSALVALTHLEMSSRGHTGELLPDTLAAFSSPASLAALSGLSHLGICEAALPGPLTTSQWLEPLTALTSLLLVQLDDPSMVSARIKAAATAAGAHCGPPTGGAAGMLAPGSFGAALAAAAQAAGTGRADQHAQAQQLLQTAQGLIPGLASLANAASNAAAAAAAGGGRSSGGGSSSGHVAAPHLPSLAGGGRTGRLTSAAAATAAASSGGGGSGASHQADGSLGIDIGGGTTVSVSDAAAAATAAAAAAALLPALPPLVLSSALPGLHQLVLANMAGERLVKLSIPSSLTRLALHLSHPCPGAVSGEQLAGVVLQAAPSLVSLELGLGMRFSLSGAVMRRLKRGLGALTSLTLIEGAQDHLEGLGCWCNLPQLRLVEGRCSVPLRGLYELSMRAAMGRTPGALRYSGHVRHLDELASRLGAAVHELTLDSLAGLAGTNNRGGGLQLLASSGGSGSTGSSPGSPQHSDAAAHQLAPSSPDAGNCSALADDAAGVRPSSYMPCALAALSSMTRLVVAGEAIGQLDEPASLALCSCRQLRELHIDAQEPWLAAELGVKEQLEWLGELRQLRLLRLSGVMLGRCRLSGGAAAPFALQDAGDSGTDSAGGSPLPLVVKGLGNGLGNGSGGGSPATKAAALCGAAATKCVKDAATAEAWDASVAACLEELRRWLCELLPHARVWLD